MTTELSEWFEQAREIEHLLAENGRLNRRLAVADKKIARMGATIENYDGFLLKAQQENMRLQARVAELEEALAGCVIDVTVALIGEPDAPACGCDDGGHCDWHEAYERAKTAAALGQAGEE